MNNKTNTFWRSLSLLMVMILAFAPIISASGDSISLDSPDGGEESKTPYFERNTTDKVNPADKLDPKLRAMVFQTTGNTPVQGPVAVEVSGQFNEKVYSKIKAYFVDGLLYGMQSKLQQQTLFGLIEAKNLLKVAEVVSVQTVNIIDAEKTEPEKYPPDDTAPQVEPKDWAELRANADSLRAESLPYNQAMGPDGQAPAAPDDWFEIDPTGPAKAADAWAGGVTGEGVRVAVLDDGVDFGHPDLYGKQAIFDSGGVYPQLDGWPINYDSFSMRFWVYQELGLSTLIAGAHSGSNYMDTSATPTLTACGLGLSCFSYTPLLYYNSPDPAGPFTYLIANSMTTSGEVHVGTHNDESLRDYVWGERVAILVTDPNVPGVYDTVYVDLDADHDFTDEKPLYKFDNPYYPPDMNSMIAIRDINNDGVQDLSGGALYFIADGTSFPPGVDWLFADSIAAAGLTPPEPGDLVAFQGPHDSGYSHGTQCASNVAGTGEVDGMMPEFSDATLEGMVYGAAPDAKIIAGRLYWNHDTSSRDNYMLAAVGWDGVDQTGWDWLADAPAVEDDYDAAQVVSNSYGSSDTFNDGWESRGVMIDEIVNNFAPSLSFLFSTGNGAPGYGTSSPPAPATGVAVGSSTEYGSTGWDTITSTAQINYNDYTAFSNSGPGARDGAGVDVLAGGSFAAGAERLNYIPGLYGAVDGSLAWSTWGGTSRSGPFASGVMALVFDAYKQANGVWPTAEQAKAILMSAATDINNEVIKQGAGAVNAAVAAAIARGDWGVYMDAGSQSWEPGDYRDLGAALAPDASEDPERFAHIVYPGETWNNTFTVVNDSGLPQALDIQTSYMEIIDTVEFDFTVTPEMVADESVYGAENRDNFYKAFNYFIPITATAGMDASMYNIDIPENADLMIVRQYYAYEEFDVDQNYNWDNRFYLMVYNWTDVDGDGLVWDDNEGAEAGHGNGVVNFINGTEQTSVDVGPELLWDDARTELDRWEYSRFGYNRPTANTNVLSVQDPLNRMHDGMFIGLRHLFNDGADLVETTLHYRIEFYQRAEVGWLDVGCDLAPDLLLEVAAHSSDTFEACVNVPVDMPPGDYAAEIEIFDMAGDEVLAPSIGDPLPQITEYDNTIIIPVVINVAVEMGDVPSGPIAPDVGIVGSVELGGYDAYNYEYNANSAYNNAAVRGYFEWGWRKESGDTRFFYMDVWNEPVSSELFYEMIFPLEPGFPPVGWSITQTVGTGTWVDGNPCWDDGYPYAAADPWCNAGGPAASPEEPIEYDTWLVSPEIDLSTAGEYVALDFFSQFVSVYDVSAFGGVYVSTDGGANWEGPLLQYEPGDAFFGYDTISLAAYAGETVNLAFRFDSDGNAIFDDWWYIFELYVYEDIFPIDPNAHVILHDQWDGGAPYTDIDTIVFGPTKPHPAEDYSAGDWDFDTYDPGYHGPYTLDTVASSVDTNAGAGLWLFDTTSGANEEWLMWPIKDGGLHEIMEHNILYQGDKVETVFTKTVGLLFEDVHEIYIDTYRDSGILGEVRLDSTIPLNGLEADGFATVLDAVTLAGEPIGAGVGLDDWIYPLTLTDTVDFYVEIDSDDISDLDLFVRYNDPVDGWIDVGASTTSTSHESVHIPNPADGEWEIWIDVWSGEPAGTFDMYLETLTRSGGILANVTEVPTAYPSSYAVELTYDFPGGLPLGETQALLFVGPPEAPQLKQIPITINRLPEGVQFIEKFIDSALHFPLDIVHYTINLWNFNLADPAFAEDMHFLMTDFIPEGTSYDSSVLNCTGDCGTLDYDGIDEVLTFEGPVPPQPIESAPANSFEVVPDSMAGWTIEDLSGPTYGWWWISSASAHSGNNKIYHRFNGTDLEGDDDWLTSAPFDVTAADHEATFWAQSDTNYPTASVTVYAVGDGFMDPLWDVIADETWNTYGWRQVTLDLSDYVDETIQLAWHYYGFDGETFSIDDVDVPGFSTTPGAVIDLFVEVDPMIAAGTYVTNTATLEGWHFHDGMAEEQEVEETEDFAVFHTGEADFSTSTKTVNVTHARLGDIIEYTITLTNSGDGSAEVYLVDPIPAGVDYFDHDPGPYLEFNYNPAFGEPGYAASFGPAGFPLAGNEMYWYGHVMPGEVLVLTFWVIPDGSANLAENYAYFEWQDGDMELYADDVIILNQEYWFPFFVQEQPE